MHAKIAKITRYLFLSSQETVNWQA